MCLCILFNYLFIRRRVSFYAGHWRQGVHRLQESRVHVVQQSVDFQLALLDGVSHDIVMYQSVELSLEVLYAQVFAPCSFIWQLIDFVCVLGVQLVNVAQILIQGMTVLL